MVYMAEFRDKDAGYYVYRNLRGFAKRRGMDHTDVKISGHLLTLYNDAFLHQFQRLVNRIGSKYTLQEI